MRLAGAASGAQELGACGVVKVVGVELAVLVNESASMDSALSASLGVVPTAGAVIRIDFLNGAPQVRVICGPASACSSWAMPSAQASIACQSRKSPAGSASKTAGIRVKSAPTRCRCPIGSASGS